MKWASSFLVGLAVLVTVGCGSSSRQIHVHNQSGQRLEEITVSGDGKSFKFGVLLDDGRAGYMTAERMFGGKFPTELTLAFESVDGEQYSRDVKYVENALPCRKLMLVIGSDLEVTGKPKPTAD